MFGATSFPAGRLELHSRSGHNKHADRMLLQEIDQFIEVLLEHIERFWLFAGETNVLTEGPSLSA